MNARAHHAEPDRRTRLLAATAAALLLAHLALAWWPAAPPQPPPPAAPPGPEALVVMEEIVRTTQSGTPPPPPPPELPPVEVEDEVVLDDVPLQIDRLDVPTPPLPGPPSDDPPGDDETTQQGASGGVTRAPSPVRMVQPPIRRDNPNAEVRVEVLVDERGRVTEATIRQRFVLRRGTREPVDALEPELEAEALEVARRWMFRPAMRNGERVAQTYSFTLAWGR